MDAIPGKSAKAVTATGGTTVPTPGNPVGSAAVQGLANRLLATIPAPQAALPRLPVGQLIPAQVVQSQPGQGQAGSGQAVQGGQTAAILLTTAQGPLRLALPFPLPLGTALTLQIQNTAQGPQLLLRHAGPEGRISAPSTPPPGPVQAGPTPDVLTRGQPLPVTLQTPSPLALNSLGLPPLPPGSALILQVIGAGLASPGLASPGLASPGLQRSGLAGPAIQSALAQAIKAGGGTALAPASPASAPGAGVPSVPPQSGQGMGNLAKAPLRFTAVIAGTTGQGQVLLQSPLGSLTSDLPIKLPLGSSLKLELVSFDRSPATANTAPTIPARPWPALESLVNLALQHQAAAELAKSLPTVGRDLGSGLMFFLAALKAGSFGALLAPQEAWLQRLGRGDLLERTGGELLRAARGGEVSPEWRLFLVPIIHNGAVQDLRFFIRREPEDGASGDEEAPGKATRFMVEVTLSRYGQLQLDGLVQPKRFDLILRSQEALPDTTRRRIMEIFQNVASEHDHRGRLTFQVGLDQVVMPASPQPRSNDGFSALSA